ncbi:MAG: aldo/keto reductase [Tepidisphaeraceae bacterium]
MRYVQLGPTNVRVSTFCLGTMMFGAKTDRDASIAITRHAIDAGVNFIDTADVYAKTDTESILGDALVGVRDRVVLASKGGMKVGEGPNDIGLSRFHLVRAVENSLKRLKTDRIDLYYLHWPFESLHLDETLRTLDDLVRAGKILYPACSNFPAWLFVRANWLAERGRYAPLVCGQYPFNLIERGIEVEVLPMTHALGLGVCIYRSLAIGTLTGKYIDNVPKETRGEDDKRIVDWMTRYGEGVRKLADFAKTLDLTAADVANAWVLGAPGVSSVIVGISQLDQLKANLANWDRATLTPEQRATVTGLFPTEVKEETGGGFGKWRRSYDIGAAS